MRRERSHQRASDVGGKPEILCSRSQEKDILRRDASVHILNSAAKSGMMSTEK